MSKKANPTAIGAFTVGGLILAVAGVILFSSSKMFSRTEQVILYFDEDLGGLDVGAPVKFRGITIGQVTEALISFDQAEDDLFMPVLVELNEDMLAAKSDRTIEFDDIDEYRDAAARGLRAKLETENFLTGRLFVNLAFITNAPTPKFHQLSKTYKEIPTVPTDIARFLRNISSVNVKEITTTLHAVLNNIDSKIDGLEVGELNQGMNDLIGSIRGLVNSPQLTNALSSANGAFVELQGLSRNLSGKVDPLAEKAEVTLTAVAAAIEEIRVGVRGLTESLAPEAPLQQEAVQMLDELNRAARSISELAEYLRRNPNSLISGRKLERLRNE